MSPFQKTTSRFDLKAGTYYCSSTSLLVTLTRPTRPTIFLMSPVKIFLTGATGYIGGAVLGRLIAHPEFSSFEISILVRDPIKAKRFEADFGLRPVIGSLDDLQLIEDEASRVDVYINTASYCTIFVTMLYTNSFCEQADADHYNATKAILAGLKRRYTTTGQTPTLIHTVCVYIYSFSKFSKLGLRNLSILCSPV
jgi:hypothetical protein